MDALKEILSSMDKSLKSIAVSLEKLTSGTTVEGKTMVTNEEEEIIFGDEIDPNHKESQLFMNITGVYMDEEMERQRAGKAKKAARRVSVKLGEKLVEFFTKELSESIVNLKIERSKIGGLIVFSVNETPIAVLKFLTDLGYSRSERFYEVVQEIQDLAEEEFSIDKENVFFLISSLFNGIEKSFVEKNIGASLSSNQEFLKNKKQVRTFVNNYINNVPTFQYPKLNIYFMAAEIHPNVLANDILEDENADYYQWIDEVNHYDWLSSIEMLFDEIIKIADSSLEG